MINTYYLELMLSIYILVYKLISFKMLKSYIFFICLLLMYWNNTYIKSYYIWNGHDQSSR